MAFADKILQQSQPERFSHFRQRELGRRRGGAAPIEAGQLHLLEAHKRK